MTNDFDTDTSRGWVAWMANNPVAANLAMVLLLVGGFAAALNIKQEVFPDFEFDVVSVTVPYPGASPEEVEQGIVLAVEEAVRGLDGVSEVVSRAREGVGVVSVELLLGADRQEVYQDVQQEVERITTFPEEAERPRVTLVARRRGVMTLALHGPHSERSLRQAAELVRDALLQDPLITQVELSAVRPYEIDVSVSRDRLRAYGLTLPQIAQILRQAAVELPGGGVKTAAGEVLVRVSDRRDFGREFAAIPVVSSRQGAEVRLGDIAEVTDAFEDIDRFATFDGEPAVIVEVFRVGDQTPLEVAAAVKRKLEELETELPPGLSLTVLRDWSDIFRQRAELLMRNGAIGLSLVLIMLGVFLEARLAFWVMMGIPISFLGGMLLLPGLGVSINMISMFAFLIALGIVVDDAIVVGENVYEYRQRGLPLIQAAVTGAREVAVPVTFSVLTNLITFVPLLTVPGVIGKIWRVIPLVVISVFAISLLESLFVLPAHLGHAGGEAGTAFGRWLHERQQRFSNGFSAAVAKYYGPFLERVLQRRYLTVAAAVAILILTIGFVQGKRIAIIPMPRVESDYSIVTAVLPYGSAVESSEKVRDRLVDAAREVAARHGGEKLVEGIFAEIGGDYAGVSGGHVVEVQAFLTRPEVRPISTRRFTELWRGLVGPVPGLEALIFESDRGGPGSGAAITVELSHKDRAILERASAELATALADFPVVSDIDDGYMPGKPQFDFRMLPHGLNLGLTSAAIASQIRSAFYGAEALRQQRGRDEIKVMVRLPEAERSSIFDIDDFLIRTPAGTDVPLHEVAEPAVGRAYTAINRREGRRTQTVTANVTPLREVDRIKDSVAGTTLPELGRKYPGLIYGFEGRQADFQESMKSLVTGFTFVLLAIYGMLAVAFRSYTQPLIIMVSIPFGIVGAVIGHVIMDYSLSTISMMGIVALAGVVVNDSLVMIDFANRQRKTSETVKDAIHAAGVRRFRPILLTTITTFGGLAPMIFETSRQARFMIPMAISLGYGILFATAITLVLVPSLYLIVEDVRRLVRGQS